MSGTGADNPGPRERLRVMGPTNEIAIAAAYIPALAYAGLALLFTALTFGGDAATVIPGIARVEGPYSGFLSGQPWGVFAAAAGFALSAAGMLTSEPLDVLGRNDPVQYLWTHRPNAFVRCIAAPWGLITSAWKRNRYLAAVPIALLPLYAVWSAVLSAALAIPFAAVWAAVSHGISKARKKERLAYRTSTRFAVCPGCRRKFPRPQVQCECGAILDYPVPGIFGIKSQTCNSGHEIPCIHGMRGGLKTQCPYCHEFIPTRESYPVCVSLVGAPKSGKTTLMLASAETIMSAAKMIDIPSEAATEGLSPDAIASRDSAMPTQAGAVGSECLFLKPLSGTGYEIVYSDIAGAEFAAKKGKDLFEEYYKYTDGIIFVFDPGTLRSGCEGLMEVFNSFYGMFSTIRGMRPGEPSDIRFAVTASKKDVSGLENSDVREYILRNGGEAFVRSAETLFEQVGYFSECGVGKRPKTSAAPVLWIAEGAGMGSAGAIADSVDSNI